MRIARAIMWICCVLAIGMVLVGMLGTTVGVRVSMSFTPADQRSQAAEDLARIHWKARRNWLYGGAFLLFVAGTASAFIALNRPPE